MTRIAVALMVVCAVTAIPRAQQSAPAFEVASIKANTSGPIRGPGARQIGFEPGGRFTMLDGATMVLLRTAYPDATEIIGAPDWVSWDHYDVQAKAAGERTTQQMAAMVRTLLVQRFKLTARVESRDQPVYALLLARENGRFGPQLQRYDGDCVAYAAASRTGERPPIAAPSNGGPACGYMASGNRIVSGGIVMARLADAISSRAGRPIIDRTGLPGHYEFILDVSPDVTVFTALREQLGLKLEPERSPLPVLLVDHIERPTPD